MDVGSLDLPKVVEALKATSGCLGVETAQTSSNKLVIFAWFEDKESVLKWYHSEFHRGLQDSYFKDRTPREPLEGVSDGAGAILAVASLTLARHADFADTSLPISQISIELYAPLTGGLFLGGRFAPEGVKVRGMRDYTPRGRAEGAPRKSPRPT